MFHWSYLFKAIEEMQSHAKWYKDILDRPPTPVCPFGKFDSHVTKAMLADAGTTADTVSQRWRKRANVRASAPSAPRAQLGNMVWWLFGHAVIPCSFCVHMMHCAILYAVHTLCQPPSLTWLFFIGLVRILLANRFGYGLRSKQNGFCICATLRESGHPNCIENCKFYEYLLIAASCRSYMWKEW